MVGGRPFFSEYANFPRRSKSPELPISSHMWWESADFGVSGGSYSFVLPFGDVVLKLSRSMSRRKEAGSEGETSIWYESQVDLKEHMVKRTPVSENMTAPQVKEIEDKDRSGVIKQMEILAAKKMKIYQTAKHYLGRFIPELKSFAVVESPRRVLESLKCPDIDDETLSLVPLSEISLMEVWERIDASKALSNMSYPELKGLYENSVFKAEAKEFANAAFQLLIKERILLDFVDDRGVHFVDTKGKEYISADVSDLWNAEANHAIPFPRTLSYDEEGIHFCDLFPVFEISPVIDYAVISKIAELMLRRDQKALYTLAGLADDLSRDIYDEDPKVRESGVLKYVTFRRLLCGMYILKKLGADLYT